MINKIFFQFIVICVICACQNNQNESQTSGDTLNTSTSVNTEQKAFFNAPVTNKNDTPAATGQQTANSVTKEEPRSPAQKKTNDPVQSRTLKAAYENYFPVGAAINPETDLKNSKLVSLLKNQFSSLTPKKAMQPMWVHPRENAYRWAEADMLVDFAQKNNMKIRGHCLIYDIHMPKWFFKDGQKKASKELILKRMKEHISVEVTRYKGKVYCWDVVNEAMRKNDSLYAILGEDYIKKAFQYAHEADPSAKLFYNDGMYDEKQRDKFYKLIKKWKSQGVPIDGIGIQYHLGIEGKSADEIQKDIDAFSSLGLEVQITELDISIYPRMSTPESVKSVSDLFTPDIENKQGDVYKTVFDICRKNKNKVTGITIWGIGDGESFLVQKLKKKNYPYLFDSTLNAKKAFFDAVNF